MENGGGWQRAKPMTARRPSRKTPEMFRRLPGQGISGNSRGENWLGRGFSRTLLKNDWRMIGRYGFSIPIHPIASESIPALFREGWIFKGGQPYVDLAVSMNGLEMATTLALLAERRPETTVELARREIERRLTGPVVAQIHGRDPDFYRVHHGWSRANHNWNAVCTAGAWGRL
jgi:hypothetical protein